jgi:Uma2 family endonuclease
MVAKSDKRTATYADIEALPDNVIGEIIHGDLYVSPRPRLRHGRAALELGADLRDPYGRGKGGPGGWIFIVEPELHLEGNVLVPDVAGWRRERWVPVGDAVGAKVAPDWVAEVLSPSTMKLDRAKKMDAYAEAGVGHVWLVDPEPRTLEVYRNVGAQWLRVGTWVDDAKVRAEPFGEIEINLAGWWLDEPAPSSG